MSKIILGLSRTANKYEFQNLLRTNTLLRSLRKMTTAATTTTTTKASPWQTCLSPITTPGVYHRHKDRNNNSNNDDDTTSAATIISRLLQQNHEDHHIFFNQRGFHNHITHHLLTLFAIDATPAQIRHAYNTNASYQRPMMPVQRVIVDDLRAERKNIFKYLTGDGSSTGNSQEGKGKKVKGRKDVEKYFADFQEFFAEEIERLGGVGNCLNEWVFKGDEVADAILGRLFAGLNHPLIHLGFGVEFHQPAIVAEALAQACVHENWFSPFLFACERAIDRTKPPRTLPELLEEARANDKIRTSVRESDASQFRDGILARAFHETVSVASQWYVEPTEEDIERKTAEMINFTAYFTGASAFPSWSPKLANKQPRMDFESLHAINPSIFYSSFAEDQTNKSWFSLKDKARLLNMKGWADLALYISRGSPRLDVRDITSYQPTSSSFDLTDNQEGGKGWDEIFRRVADYKADDGHAVKLVRALANGERVCRKFETEDWCVIKGDMWQRLGHVMADVIDSVEADGGDWVYIRGAGFERAWDHVPDKKEKQESLSSKTKL